MDELRPGSSRDAEHHDDENLPILGDIVLCPAFASDQAATAGHSLNEELHLLTVHGVLHLLGYDHAEPDEEREMFVLQAQILGDWRATR
jgi:probable rRNA maturation factor